MRSCLWFNCCTCRLLQQSRTFPCFRQATHLLSGCCRACVLARLCVGVQVADSWSSAQLLRAGVPRFLLEEMYAALGKVRIGQVAEVLFCVGRGC